MILIIRHKSADKEFQIKLDKNNLIYLYQPVLKFKYIKKKITNADNKIFIIASIQAVRSIHSHNREYLNQIKGSQIFVIGKKVKDALVKLGVNNIIKTFDSTTTLLKFIHKKNSFKKIKFEYLCGSVVNDEFVKGMKDQKHSLKKRIVYQITPTKELLKKTQIAIKNKRIRVVVFYSIYSAEVFIKLLRKYGLLSLINKDMKILCFSERISRHIISQRVLPNENIMSIINPNSQSLLRSLKKILNTKLSLEKNG